MYHVTLANTIVQINITPEKKITLPLLYPTLHYTTQPYNTLPYPIQPYLTLPYPSFPYTTLQHSLSYLTDSSLVAAALVTRLTRSSRLFFSKLKSPYQPPQSVEEEEKQKKTQGYDVIVEHCTLVVCRLQFTYKFMKKKRIFCENYL